jgi:nucleoside-diphosphate-sugar epimerase
VYSAGRLFAPRPEGFLPVTNVEYVRNLAVAARAAGVRRFVLMSFPHVEGETTPDRPARGLRDGTPSSVHARTRLQAENCLFEACAGSQMSPVVLRVGAVYGPGILMLEAARKIMRWRLMAVWRRPTWLHLIALPDLLTGIQAAVEKQGLEGIYPLCDDRPITLQDFLDRMARELGYPRPRRLPAWCFLAAGAATELYATVTGGIAPLTRDFIRIGMSSSVADTSRRTELVSRLAYPTLEDGTSLLHPTSASQ